MLLCNKRVLKKRNNVKWSYSTTNSSLRYRLHTPQRRGVKSEANEKRTVTPLLLPFTLCRLFLRILLSPFFTLRTDPVTFGCFIQSETSQMVLKSAFSLFTRSQTTSRIPTHPFIFTFFIVTTDHLTVRYLFTETICRFVRLGFDWVRAECIDWILN